MSLRLGAFTLPWQIKNHKFCEIIIFVFLDAQDHTPKMSFLGGVGLRIQT
jgi:hypothetical protein